MYSDNKPSITLATDGPYLVKTLKNLANQKAAIDCKETMALCRCGESANKPFCDGSYWAIEFSDENTRLTCFIEHREQRLL